MVKDVADLYSGVRSQPPPQNFEVNPLSNKCLLSYYFGLVYDRKQNHRLVGHPRI